MWCVCEFSAHSQKQCPALKQHAKHRTTPKQPKTKPKHTKGTIKLIDAAKAAGARRFVLLTSLLTNAKEAGQADNPNYKFLNLFGGVLDHKV